MSWLKFIAILVQYCFTDLVQKYLNAATCNTPVLLQ